SPTTKPYPETSTGSAFSSVASAPIVPRRMLGTSRVTAGATVRALGVSLAQPARQDNATTAARAIFFTRSFLLRPGGACGSRPSLPARRPAAPRQGPPQLGLGPTPVRVAGPGVPHDPSTGCGGFSTARDSPLG